MVSDLGYFPVQAWSPVGKGNLHMWKQQQENAARPSAWEVANVGHVDPQKIQKITSPTYSGE